MKCGDTELLLGLGSATHTWVPALYFYLQFTPCHSLPNPHYKYYSVSIPYYCHIFPVYV